MGGYCNKCGEYDFYENLELREEWADHGVERFFVHKRPAECDIDARS